VLVAVLADVLFLELADTARERDAGDDASVVSIRSIDFDDAPLSFVELRFKAGGEFLGPRQRSMSPIGL
jgi:hypothetical protein